MVLLKISISSACFGRNYRPKHAELIEIVNKTIIVATSWLFILLYPLYNRLSLQNNRRYNSFPKFTAFLFCQTRKIYGLKRR